ncbi:MAG: peptidylprolyl isomerase [Clostridia bacterium]|nr:peptidylprolyl isomerase [Clostridia bacterium]
MKRKICLLLCLTLALGLLTGCKLIVKDEAVDAATTAVEVNGEAITKGEINDETTNYLNYMNMIYQAYGYGAIDVNDQELIASTRESMITELIEDRVLKQKAAGYGVEYEVGNDEALKHAATEGKVEVAEEKLTEAFQTKVEADQAAYTDQASYAAAVNNGTESYYVPGEIRMVKQILIAFTDEEQNELKALKAEIKELKATVEASEATPAEETAEEAPADETADEAAEEEDPKAKLQRLEEEYNQKLAAACANVQEEVDHVMEELRNGGDWDAICAEHNDDPGMTAGRKTAETGYAVFEGYEDFDEVFVKAAMALESPGDFTDPTASAFGYYIIRLERDLTEGAIPFEDVRDALYETAYEEAEKELFDQLVEQWVSEANVVRHDEVFK